MSNGHPWPEQVSHRVKKFPPSLSPSTVYKAFDTFCSVGRVAKITCLNCTSSYCQTNTSQLHQLICKNCHKIEDIYSKRLDILRIPQALIKENKLSGVSLNLEGIRKECQNTK
ncbi:MAG: hypothetical protein GXO76_15325 [Calditrichaeota bacterium]|nr:hypothetical protein [Calditrichota bacterium]